MSTIHVLYKWSIYCVIYTTAKMKLTQDFFAVTHTAPGASF